MGPSILIVDDDPRLLNVMAAFFELKGFEVHTADGGVRGLEEVRRSRPAVVILDVMMPDMDGIAVCREIKTDPALADTTVLMLSAREQLAAAAASAGASGAVSKPFDLEDLLSHVRRLTKEAVTSEESPEPLP